MMSIELKRNNKKLINFNYNLIERSSNKEPQLVHKSKLKNLLVKRNKNEFKHKQSNYQSEWHHRSDSGGTGSNHIRRD